MPLALQPALQAPAPGDVYLRSGAATCDTIEIQIAVHAVPGVFTTAFDLRYPAALVKYEGSEAGPLLLKGPPRTRPFVLVQAPSPGQLVVTMTRFAPDGGVTADGSEVLLGLRFSRLAAGSGDIDFDRDAASPIAERIVDAAGSAVAARFGPGHGATLTVYQR